MNTINNQFFKLQPQCQNQESNSSRLRWPQSLHSHSRTAQSNRSRWPNVARGLRTGLLALSRTVSANNRIYIGLGFLLVAAPLASVCYQVFSRSVRVEGYYYLNNFYLFLTLAPFITQICISTGIFFLFPEGSRRAYFLAIPLAQSIAKIIWLTTVTSNEDYYSIVPTYFLLPCGLVAFLWLITMDWLVHRQYHELDALWARLRGIKSAPIDESLRMELIDKTTGQIIDFQKKY